MKRREQLFALLREQQADVIGLQEALHGQIEEILRAVPGYAYVGVGRSDGRRAGSTRRSSTGPPGCTSRRSDTFWFSDTPGVVKSRRGATPSSASARGRTSRTARARPSTSTTCTSTTSRSRRASAARRCCCERIGARDPKAPVVVTGDFNAGEDNPAAHGDARRRSATPSASLHPDADGGGHVHRLQVRARPPATRSTTCSSSRAPRCSTPRSSGRSRDGRYPSDHFPVTARVRLR